MMIDRHVYGMTIAKDRVLDFKSSHISLPAVSNSVEKWLYVLRCCFEYMCS